MWCNKFWYNNDVSRIVYPKEIKSLCRCMCEIILAGLVAFLFSFATSSSVSNLLTTLLDHQLCTINWSKAAGYFYTVVITTVIPCIICVTFNFALIFYWRVQWQTGRTKTKLNGATVEALLDSTHVVCPIMFMVFWSSWMPFFIDFYRFPDGRRSLSSASTLYFWLGCSQGIWKFPIMMLCPRYRNRMFGFCVVRAAKPVSANENICDVEINPLPYQQLDRYLTEHT